MRSSSDNLALLLNALMDFAFGLLGLGMIDFDTVLQLGQSPRRIDILTAIDGLTFVECSARRKQVDDC